MFLWTLQCASIEYCILTLNQDVGLRITVNSWRRPCSTAIKRGIFPRLVVITTNGITYKNNPFHKECFLCTNCNVQLAGQKFTVKEERPYCAACYAQLFAKRCSACKLPIIGLSGASTKFVSFENRHWHNECFDCSQCRQSLVGKGFITDEDSIICPDCAKTKFWSLFNRTAEDTLQLLIMLVA